jgi:flagellar biosynthesis protein FlhG
MPEILLVASGKGGVGKTCFAANMAVEISRMGWQVILVDADLGCANCETVLGTRSEYGLDDFFYRKGRKDLEGVLCETQYENLRLIPGTTGLLDVANPKYQQKQAFIRELRKLEADLVIVDLAAGAHLNTLDLFLLAETSGILVITPEKTSIDNAFKFLRAALFRKIERFYRCPDVAELMKRNISLNDFIGRVQSSGMFDEFTKNRLCGEMAALANGVRPRVVVNRARNAYEAQIASNILAKLARQSLRVSPENLGFIYYGGVVPQSVNAGVPFVVSHPRAKISGCIVDIANRLGYV